MEKNPTCVSTTPEEMYQELQAEKEQIRQNAPVPTLPKEEYGWLEKNDKYIIIYKNDCQTIRNQDVVIILEKETAKQATVTELLPHNKELSPTLVGEIVLKMLKHNPHGFFYLRGKKIYELPNAPEIIPLYIKNYRLCNEEQIKAFNMPNAQEIILAQVKYHELNNPKAQLKVFDLPNAQEILLIQAKKYYGGLYKEAQLKAFDLPNAQEILLAQAKQHYLCEEAQLKAFELPNAQEFILKLIEESRFHLCDEAIQKARKLDWL